MYYENITHNILPEQPKHTVDTKYDGSMLSHCLHPTIQMLQQKLKTSVNATFFQSPVAELCFLFTADTSNI